MSEMTSYKPKTEQPSHTKYSNGSNTTKCNTSNDHHHRMIPKVKQKMLNVVYSIRGFFRIFTEIIVLILKEEDEALSPLAY